MAVYQVTDKNGFTRMINTNNLGQRKQLDDLQVMKEVTSNFRVHYVNAKRRVQ